MNVTQTMDEDQKWGLQDQPLRWEIRLLFMSALIVFIVTVLIGLLNGQRIMTLSTDVLLTHVHAGTLGWITLSVFAVSLWLFSDGGVSAQEGNIVRWLSIISAAAVPIYVLAFLSGNYIARAVFGIPVLLVMLAFLGWVAYRIRMIQLGVAQLAILGSLLTLVLGGILGVLLQFQFASNRAFLPTGAFAAHLSTMVAGYLVLIGMALSEWRLIPQTDKVPRLGIIQVSLFFVAGLCIGVGFLLNLIPLLSLNTLLSVVGVIIYIARFAPKVARLNWLERTSKRFFAISGAFIVVNIILTVYSVVSVITNAFPNGDIPSNILIALDHSMFVGVMTNALFGILRDATAERRAVWPWAEDVLFWGMNVGLVGFLVALLTGILSLERLFTPIMGLSILLGIVVYIARFMPATGTRANVAGPETNIQA